MAQPGVPSTRTQHLVFLAHVWACVPFMIPWTQDPVVHAKLGDPTIAALRPFVGVILLYLVARTWLAWKGWERFSWNYLFPPIDVILISALLAISHRGPLSNLTMLYFLPIAQAAGSLNVRWAAMVGFLVVFGTALATLSPPVMPANEIYKLDPALRGVRELILEDPLNVSFRVYFLIVVSSLMTYQARIAAEYRAEARLAEDRNRLALDVHDGVQGSLIAVSSGLEVLSHVATHHPERVPELAQEIRASARDAADELRFLVQRLRPPSLTGGFLPALRQYVHAQSVRYGWEVNIEVDEPFPILAPETEQTLFRVIQESLNNVAKHAQATQVWLSIRREAGQLRFSVRDDGIGDQAVADGTGRMGMRERITSMKGSLDFSTGPDGGTEVYGSIPL